MMSFCGVLNSQRLLVSRGSMMRANSATEITGVCALAAMSIVASEAGLVVDSATPT